MREGGKCGISVSKFTAGNPVLESFSKAESNSNCGKTLTIG